MVRLFILFSLLICAPALAAGTRPPPFKLGLEVLLDDHLASLRDKNVGLVTNMTGVNQALQSNIDLLRAQPGVRLVALFGPEHGVRGETQAGVNVASTVDEATGLPVHSLYGAAKGPTAEMLKGVDLLLFDIQDVGARYYTYPYTLLAVMHAAARAGIPIIVLDRPNPLGGVLVEGPVLERPFVSFVGKFAMPVRHGMTMGEMAKMFAAVERIDVQLTVIKMQGWKRDANPFRDGLAWIAPSPNMPTPDTAMVYPGTALLEGTNISEGRGTTKPFEMIGAPFINASLLSARLNAQALPGVIFRPAYFTPSFSKYAGEGCAGIQLHVTDAQAFRPFRTGVTLVKMLHDLYPAKFAFHEGTPGFFDTLAGTDAIRLGILEGQSVGTIEAHWQQSLDRFSKTRDQFLLY